ncbi:MAG TPA: 1-acyl-sn-glycerol-3-phosphate acyltransferase, partial [Anaeromyxobacteraceae bacterium]
QGARARAAAREARGDGWVLDLVAEVSRRPRAGVTRESLLAADLGFDSLMLTELAAALEEAGVPASVTETLHRLETVGELARAAGAAVHRVEAEPAPPAPSAEVEGEPDVALPQPLAALGRRLLGAGQRVLYRDLYHADVRGRAFIPRDRNFLVVANHASHLDMGLVKVALGDQGGRLAALAARDYFFDTTLKRAYFENFTNLIPMERAGSVRQSLRAAVEALRQGLNLLIFPEGTRSRDGQLARFKPTAGYLALQCGVDALPLFIRGTHQALPPGQLLPRAADLEVIIGQPIAVEELRRRTAHLPRGDAHKEATRIMEEAVRALGGLAPIAPAAPRTTVAASPADGDSTPVAYRASGNEEP